MPGACIQAVFVGAVTARGVADGNAAVVSAKTGDIGTAERGIQYVWLGDGLVAQHDDTCWIGSIPDLYAVGVRCQAGEGGGRLPGACIQAVFVGAVAARGVADGKAAVVSAKTGDIGTAERGIQYVWLGEGQGCVKRGYTDQTVRIANLYVVCIGGEDQ